MRTLKGLRPVLQSPAPAKFILGLSTHLWAFIHPQQNGCLAPGQRDYKPRPGICCHISTAHMTEAPAHIFKISDYPVPIHPLPSWSLKPWTVSFNTTTSWSTLPDLACQAQTSAFTCGILDSTPGCLLWNCGKCIFLGKIMCCGGMPDDRKLETHFTYIVCLSGRHLAPVLGLTCVSFLSTSHESHTWVSQSRPFYSIINMYTV